MIEICSAGELRDDIIRSRGGLQAFDGVQQRLLDSVVSELAKAPSQINVRAVSDLMSMLPPPRVPAQHRVNGLTVRFVDPRLSKYDDADHHHQHRGRDQHQRHGNGLSGRTLTRAAE